MGSEKIFVVFSLLLAIVNCHINKTWIYDAGEIFNDLWSEEPAEPAFLLGRYDFIVVGAGTAGCVVARRLSDNPAVKVLLVEYGWREPQQAQIPIEAGNLQSTDINWNFKTVPQAYSSFGLNNNVSNWARGRVMGGSSVINYMIYTRGSPKDFDGWSAAGCTGWAWSNILPLYKKVEKYLISQYYNSASHSNTGNVEVSHVRFRTDAIGPWITASQEAGYQLKSQNDLYQSGVAYLEVTHKSGARHSANRAYLSETKGRQNLHVIKRSMVTELTFSADKTRVTGIRVERRGVQYTIAANKEVVVCAGTIKSPQLLMLSGIGPRSELEALGIAVVKDLPVGRSLKDHLIAVGTYITVTSNLITATLQETLSNPLLQFWYNGFRNGPFTLSGGVEGLAYKDLANDGHATYELLFLSGTPKSDASMVKNINMRQDLYNTVYGNLPSHNAFTVSPVLLRPKSSGTVKLASKNPYDQPLIDPKYLQHPDDVAVLVEGVREVARIVGKPALQAHNAKLWDVPLPGCASYPYFSTAYLECFVRHLGVTLWHPTSTCKMGPVGDPTAVVGPNLKVHGLAGVRVADSSIMPDPTTGHTNAPTYVIGEKCAELIKAEYNI